MTEVVEPPSETAAEMDSATVAGLRQNIERILQLDAEAEAARSSGDITTYFERNQEQTRLLQQLQQQMDEAGGAESAPTETPAP